MNRINEASRAVVNVIYNRFLPVCGFEATILFGYIFARHEFEPISEQAVRHVLIHALQAAECGGWIRYYVRYIFYRMRWGCHKNPFECEAYRNMADPEYLDLREPFTWKKYIA